jgi:hypothetical protein
MSKEELKPTAKADHSPTDGQESNQETSTVKDPEAVLAKNRELLGKLKEASDKLKEIEKQNYSLKSEKLTAEGKKDELIETLKEQLEATKRREAEVTWKAVSRQIGIEATKKGCKNVDTLLKVVDFKNASIDQENFSVASEDINMILEKAMKDHDYLFDKGVKGPKDAGPGARTEAAPKSLKEMSTKDLLEMYKKVSLS